MTLERRIYEIACLFPALQRKGLEDGHIPGILPDRFYARELADYLYKGEGGALSHGEFLLLEFLLNIYSPEIYNRFNFAEAVNTLDGTHMKAFIQATARVYNKQ